MPDTFKALGAVQLVVMEEGNFPRSPLGRMSPELQSSNGMDYDAMLIYEVPPQRDAIIKMIVVTSAVEEQAITLEVNDTVLGIIPLFGPVVLGVREWAEWSGSLTISGGGKVVGCTSGGQATVAVYGMERDSP